MTEYEAVRAAKMARNNAYLESLGLKKNKEALNSMAAMDKVRKRKKRQSKPRKKVAPGEERRSSRVKGDKDNLVQLDMRFEDGKCLEQADIDNDLPEGDYFVHGKKRYTGSHKTVNVDREVRGARARAKRAWEGAKSEATSRKLLIIVVIAILLQLTSASMLATLCL
jgi:hypothetical protein